MRELTPRQRERYARNIALAEVGEEGQGVLLESRALVVGAGGLGSPVAYYLAAAGVGHLTLADPDRVDLSNLQRQILHSTPDLGRLKVEVAKGRLEAMNPDCHVEPLAERLDLANIVEVISRHQVVVDATDGFRSKFMVNDASILAGVPCVHGAVLGLGGEVLTVLPRQGACLRCIFLEPPPPDEVPNPREAGILGAVAGLVGCIQALEAVKVLLSRGRNLVGRLLLIEGLDTSFREVAVGRNPACAVCGEEPTILALKDDLYPPLASEGL